MQRTRGQQRETNGHTCTDFVDRMTVRESVAHADIEGQVLAHLPDQSDEAGHGFRFAELLLVKNLCDGAHRPLRRPFDDDAGEEISAMLTGQRCDTMPARLAPNWEFPWLSGSSTPNSVATLGPSFF